MNFLTKTKNSIKYSISEFWRYAKHNLLNMAIFEILFNLFLIYILLPGFEWTFTSLVRISGAPYLEQGNIGILLNPLCVISLLICLFVAGYFIFFEINALIINYRHCEEKLPFWNIFWLSLKESTKIFLPKNWGILLLVLLVIPLRNGLFVTSFAQVLKVPGFIIEFIEKDNILGMLYLGLLLIFTFILFFGCFVFHEMAYERKGFFTCFVNSFKLVKSHFVKTFITMVLAVYGILVVLKIIEIGSLIFYAFILKHSMPISEAQMVFTNTYISISYGIAYLENLVIIISQIAAVTSLYVSYKHIEKRPVRYAGKNWRVAVVALTLAVVITGVSFTQGVALLMQKDKISVTAHRAGAAYAPENTISALEISIAFNADYSEIDIQQLSDLNLIVSHDTNFQRISNVNKDVWETNLVDVKTYDAGSYYSDSFKNEKYPTLVEALNCCKDRMKLVIELKSSGHEKGLEEETIKEIKENNMQDQVVLASMNSDILKKIKEIDPNIKTQLISSVAFGDYSSMDYADILSIENTFITSKLVSKIHADGKEIFAWTINDLEAAKKVVSMGIDSIISDDVLMVKIMLSGFSGDDVVDEISVDYISSHISGWEVLKSLFMDMIPINFSD